MAQMCIAKGLLLLLVCVNNVIGLCQPSQPKVTVPSSVTVKHGSTVNISSDSFRIIFSSSYQCKIYFISTSTYSCGIVSPDVFDCNSFGHFSYTHYGCDKETENLDFAVYLISSNQTVLNTKYVSVKVKVEDDNNPVLPVFDKIIVPSDTMSVSIPLKLLAENLTCEYAIVSPMRLPYYGNVTGPTSLWLACNSSHTFEYSLHSDHRPPQSEDRVVAAVRFANSNTRFVQIRVVIDHANNVESSCSNTQGVLPLSFSTYTPVNIEHLLPNCSVAVERDWKVNITKSNHLVIFAITSHGQHVSTDLFTIEQLQNGLVTLCTTMPVFPEVPAPSEHHYTIHDVYGRPIFNGSVITRWTPLETHLVQVSTNDGINVLEGQSVRVTSDILEFIVHNCSDLTISIIEPPKHGQFISAETNMTQTEFTITKDLRRNIIFNHSGDDNFADRAIWEIQCYGNNIGKFLQPIRVTVLDDSPPFLVSKSAMSVHAYEIVQISLIELQASDVDSCDIDIRYNISQSNGTLFSSKKEALNGSGNGLLEFTQSDIDSGNVWYRPPDDVTIMKDIILFSLSDNSSPPNVLSNQQLKINILKPMNIPAALEMPLNSDSIMKMPVVEIGNVTLLLPIHFSWFTEQFSWLKITVVVPPESGNLSQYQFTLEDLNMNRIVYRHYGVEHSCKDNFIFQMSNSSGAQLFGKLVIAMVNLNMTHDVSLQVSPLGFSNIRPALATNSITVLDSPVCIDHLLFNIETAPRIGTLYINKSLCSIRKLGSGSWFSLQDVRNGFVTYEHNSSHYNSSNSSYVDEFTFSLSSPVGRLTLNGDTTIRYSIVYTMVDPVVVLRSPSTLYPCHSSSNYCYNLSSVNIDVKSQVANDSEIIIDVKGLPSYGRLMNTNGRQSNTFTMLELRNKEVIYEIDLSLWQNAISNDSFTFFVRVAAQRVKSQQSYVLTLMWNYIFMEEPKLEVNETDGEFSVTVRRRGRVSFPGSIVCTYGSLSGSCEECGSIKVVRFSSNQTVAHCTFSITDNHVPNGVKKNFVSLRKPQGGVLTHRNATTDILISDYEDYPIIGFVNVRPLMNSHHSCQRRGIEVIEGDKTISVKLERTGDTSEQVSVKCETVNKTAKPSQDYKERYNRVTFEAGQTTTFCNVTIVDDDEFEEQEFFQLQLNHPLHRVLINQTSKIFCILINEDSRDKPVVYFNRSHEVVHERSSNYPFPFPIFRTKNTKFITTDVKYRTVVYRNDTASDADFENFTSKSVTFANNQAVTQGSVLIYFDNLTESAESFHIELIQSSHYQLGSPSIIKVTILDRFPDTFIGFGHSSYTIKEEVVNVSIELHRSGNLSFEFAITMECTLENKNYNPLILFTTVTFQADESNSQVPGYIIDNSIYQGIQRWGSCCLLSDQDNNYIVKFSIQCIEITISDEDFPSARFEHANYTVQKPSYPHQCHEFAFGVVRLNSTDDSIQSIVKYYTEDNTAIAGKDYVSTTGTLYFISGDKKKHIYVKICSFSGQYRKFTIHLVGGHISTNLTDVKVVTTPSVAEIVILDDQPVFPDFHEHPIVFDLNTISLQAAISPSSLICVTPCDPLSPSYGNNTRYCNEQGIDNNRTLYSWEIYYNGTFVPITYSTFFVSSSSQVLDGFYLTTGDRVRCTTTAVDTTDVIGYSRCSESFELPRKFDCNNSIGIKGISLQPSPLFAGKDKDAIKVSGSLRRFGNGVPMLYAQQHVSSSPLILLTHFPTRNRSCVLFTGDSNAVINCTWSFEVWLTVEKLKDSCNADVSTIGNKTHIKLDLQLVYYHGNANHASVQYLKNISISEEFDRSNPSLLNVQYSKYNAGSVKVLAVSFVNGTEVTFLSVANFTGQFYPGSKTLSSHVDNLYNLTLALKETEPSIHTCVQTWTLTSINDTKSGLYNISLLPCVLPDNLTWSPSVMSHCIKQEPVVFQLNIPSVEKVLPHFDRVETELQLFKRDKMKDRYSPDWKYSPDDTVYVGINKSNKDHHYSNVTIIICSSAFGYVPHYNPEAGHFGCQTNSQYITPLYTIMEFNSATDHSFDAKFLSNVNGQPLWSFKTKPLSNGTSDTQLWYLHVIYNVSSFPYDLRTIHELRAIYVDKDSSNDDTSNAALCNAIVIVLVLLSVIVVVLMISSFACWKWSRTKWRDEQHCDSDNATGISSVRRMRSYRAEVQKLPQAFPPPNSIHGNSIEHNAKHATTHSSNGLANSKRLTGSKKYIVETTM